MYDCACSYIYVNAYFLFFLTSIIRCYIELKCKMNKILTFRNKSFVFPFLGEFTKNYFYKPDSVFYFQQIST